MSLSDRQAQMGHGDVRMTLHYTHSEMDPHRKGIDAMSKLLVAPSPATVN